MKKGYVYIICILYAILSTLTLQAAVYQGYVRDEKGAPIAYATVYPELVPEWGTATNNDGYFSFEGSLTPDSRIIFSFIGYEKVTMSVARFLASGDSLPVVVLREQPIALEETVVAAKKSKQKNKRKQISTLLHAVYVQLEADFPDETARYQIVSDVRMQSAGLEPGQDSHSAVWGMEQMIANIVVQPETGKNGQDSVQFQGRYCKRFFSAEKRAQADSILASNAIERMEKKSKHKFMRKAANAVDSGVVVHHALFAMGNMRYDFEQTMTDWRHWTVSNESETETVLTHTQTISKYLGCFKVTYLRHYIVDSKTYAVRRFSEHAEVKITIPFGVKLNPDQLQILNLINMGDKQIEKFRLKKAHANIDYNTIYQRRDGHVYTLEKNMLVNAEILGSKKAEIPIVVKGTQRVTDLQTTNVQLLKADEITRRVPRQIVEIY